MNIQLISLLSAIIAIISGLLTVSEKVNKIKLSSVIRLLTVYVLPILFIQQIIIFTNKTINAYSAVLIFGAVISIVLSLITSRKGRKIDSNGIFVLIIICLSSIMLFLHPLYIEQMCPGYNSLLNSFISELTKYKITYEMFLFLSKNLSITLSILSDTVAIVILLIIEINFCNQYRYELFDPLDDRPARIAPSRFHKLTLYSLFFSTGVSKWIIFSVVALF